MKDIIILSFLFINLSFNLFSQDLEPKPDIKYKNNLDQVIVKLVRHQKVPLKEIENCIPNTDDNYGYFYHYTYPDKSNNEVAAFYKLDSIIYKNAELGKMNFPKKVFFLADFVDGEYAESYEGYLQKIVLNNVNCFCKTYLKLSEDRKIWLENYYLNHCKK